MDSHRIRLKAIDTGGGSDRIEKTPKHDRRFENPPPVGRQVVAEQLDDAVEHVSVVFYVAAGAVIFALALPQAVRMFRDA
ncbi:MAG: hypothetical protein GY871_16630, partial [Actinomycetales bacterium]|nr:hypothetical protein [Actinomycetales bacterium]